MDHRGPTRTQLSGEPTEQTPYPGPTRTAEGRIGRIVEDQIGRWRIPIQEVPGVHAHEIEALQIAQGGGILAELTQCPGMPFHRDDPRGPPRQGLEAEYSAARVDIPDQGPGDQVPEMIHHGLARPFHQRTSGPDRGYSQLTAPVFPGGDPQHGSRIRPAMPRLHVNIDHVATVRQARRGASPDPVAAAVLCELAGADGITVHLREDRRHIQDRDLRLLRETVQSSLNMEMALNEEMVGIACELKPDEVCLVPEKRQELTTEGGLDAEGRIEGLREQIPRLQGVGILVSLFLDPIPEAIEVAAQTGADFIELHTGRYANGRGADREAELKRLETAARYAHELGLRVNAGHGLDYRNVQPVAALPFLEELNIGHAIVARSVLVGLERAVGEMLECILGAAPTAE